MQQLGHCLGYPHPSHAGIARFKSQLHLDSKVLLMCNLESNIQWLKFLGPAIPIEDLDLVSSWLLVDSASAVVDT